MGTTSPWTELVPGHGRPTVALSVPRHGQQPAGAAVDPLGTVSLGTKQTPDTVH